MELTELQKKIINAPENKIAVDACAAALKTSTLIEKVRKLLRDGNDPSSIAVITFTRMAATELIDRLGEDYKPGLFVGTIHSLGARFLSINGLGGRIKQIAEDEDFDKIFELCKDLNIKKSYDWVLVDEMQDTGEKEMEFIFDLINPEHYFVCFDVRQSIYGFKGARPDLLMKYLERDATFYTMNENYRNGRNILDFARRILYPIGMEDSSISMRPISGTVSQQEYSGHAIVNLIKGQGKPGDWAILTRTNQEISTVSAFLKKAEIPFDTFKQADLSREELTKRMEADTVKVLTIHSSKGLAFNNVIVVGARFHPDDERNVCYVAATRARNKLVWMSYAKKKKGPPKVRGWE